MVATAFTGYTDPLVALAQDMSSQRSRLAQYPILQASKYLQDKRYDEAIREFNKALALDPQNTTALDYIGKINLSQGKYEEAIKSYRNWVSFQPNSVEARVALGNAYMQDKQYQASEKEFQYAARLDPNSPLADYTLGIQYQMTDRLAEAESQFIKVRRMAPGDGNVHYSLGALYSKQGKYEEAIKSLDQALNLKPNFPAAKYELGVAYSRLGMTDKAQTQYKDLVNMGSPFANDLGLEINKPQLLWMDTGKSGGFVEHLGPNTPVWMLNANLIAPDSSQQFSITFQFTTEMDPTSVSNPANWTITRANSAEAGYYNDLMPTKAHEARIAENPLAVTYDLLTSQATIRFIIAQNASGDATIDPTHLVFKFNGVDVLGRAMDEAADEVDGYAGNPF